MSRLILSVQYILAAALLTSCASSGPSPEEQIRLKEFQEAQQLGQLVDSIYLGQDFMEVSIWIAPMVENFFEVLEEGSIHQYIQSRHPQTGALFGLYFEDRKLVGLVVEQDVTEFHVNRLSNSDEPHWMSTGFAPHKEWILSKNRIDDGFYTQVQIEKEPKKITSSRKSHITFEEVGEFSRALLALILILSIADSSSEPIIWGEVRDDDQPIPETGNEQIIIMEKRKFLEKQKRKEQVAKLESIQIGVSEEKLVGVMDQIGRRIHIERPDIYTYLVEFTSPKTTRLRPSYSFGVKDNLVYWLETCSMLTGSEPPRGRVSDPNNWSTTIRCGKLEGISTRDKISQ